MAKGKSNYLLFIYGLISLGFICCFLSCSNAPANSQGIANDQQESGMQASSNKIALLVGINKYQHMRNLKGAVNDVINMKRLLIERFGFIDDNEHICVLTDENATRNAIIKGIEDHLIPKAKSDSIVVFHYSGHGSKVKDMEGDETDKWDEAIVPHDSGHNDPHPNRDIIDDEINLLLGKLTDKTPYVTFIFDSCHSGTAIRAAGLARTVEPDYRERPELKFMKTKGARAINEGKCDFRFEGSQFALISGSKAEESSYELNRFGKWHGALTWHLTNQISKTGADATYRDIMDFVKARVTARYNNQHPQLEGPGMDQYIFSAKSLAPFPYVLANPGPSNLIILKAGQVHGVTEGSVYDVYAPGTKSIDKDIKPIAKIRVTEEVDIIQSKARLIEGDRIPKGSRAIEQEHYWPDVVLNVFFKEVNESECLKKIKSKLSDYKHIRSLKTETEYDILLREENGYIVTEGGDITEIASRVPVSSQDAVSRVVEVVTHWAKWYNVFSISHHYPELKVEFEIKKAEGSPESQPELADQDISITFPVGEIFTIEVTNKSKKNIYIVLLDLSSDGSVEVIFPKNQGEEFIAPEKTWKKKFETWLPDGLDSIRDVLKLIATTSYVDFNFLELGALRKGPELMETRGKSRNPLEQLLANAALGTTRSGIKGIEIVNWTTVDRVLEVHRKDE